MMEACIDTLSSIFSSTSEYSRNPSRNLSPFSSNANGFENSCQNRSFSVLSSGGNSGGNISDSNYNHYHVHHHQQQPTQRQSDGMMISNGCSGDDYLQTTLPTASWTDRQMSNDLIGLGSKMDVGISNNGTSLSASKTHLQQQQQQHHHPPPQQQQHHGFQPNSFANGSSFNLEQLHHGICSVGRVPSWQQSFAFGECGSTNVPSQNDEANDTIPMPLPMSSIPTTSSPNPNHNSKHTNNTNHGQSRMSNGQCNLTATNNNFHTFLNVNDHQHQQQQAQLNSQFINTGSSYQNDKSGQQSSTSPSPLAAARHQQVDSMSVCSDSLTLSFSASLLNGNPDSPQQHSPYMTSTPPPPKSNESASTYSTPEFVKMATPPTRNVRLRTNTRLDMDRQKAQEEDRRDKELQKQQQRSPIQSTAAVPVNLPPAVNVVVPSKVLQVTSALENPTPFHVEQTRRFKIRQYYAGIANSLPEGQGTTTSLGGTTLAVQPLRPPAKLNRVQHLISDGTVSSAPPNYSTTPLSPISTVEPAPIASPGPSQRSSVATSANDEFEESILDLLLDEKTGDGDVASLPQPGFNRVSGVPEASSSCPVESTQENVVSPDGNTGKVSKDRIKKDNHNKIERKRRFHINDMITEQGRLLPKSNERHHEKIGEVKQNKGSILKASVDYTKVLKQDNEVLHQKLQKAELEKKELLLRLQRVEQLCKQTGVHLPDDIITWKTGSTPEDLHLPRVMTPEIPIKQEPMFASDDFDRNICDMMEEDRSIVTGSTDPMFGLVEADDGFHHTEGMDFND